MATLFMDYTNGLDANNGTTFANRFKTIDTGATAARTAPGDTIKIMMSPNPTSLAQNASFTNKSDTITLTTAVTANVSLCNTSWTPLTNITTTTDTSTYKQGTASTSIAPNATFTTGLAAYEAMSSTDYSAYEQLSFWIRSSVNVAANGLSIKLCSDAAGVTAVDTFQITNNLVANRWYPLTINKGSALGSAIQSVALYINTDFGAATILVDNILACKAVSADDSLSVNSLIGKGGVGEYYFPIRSINGTTIKLDSNANSTFSTTPRGYSGVTETVNCMKRECIKAFPIDTSTAWGNSQESGTSGNLITYSGGWNTTDMTTQDGDTYIDFHTSQPNFFNATSNFLAVEKIVAVRSALGFQTGADCTWSNVGTIGSGGSAMSLANSRITTTGTLFSIACQSNMSLTSQEISIANVVVLSCQNDIGLQLGSTSGFLKQTGTIKANNCSSAGCNLAGAGEFGDITASDNGNNGVTTSGSNGPQLVQSITANSNTGHALSVNAQANLTINSLSTTGNTVGVITHSGSVYSRVVIKNPVYAEGTFHTGTLVTGSGSILQVHNDNNTGAHFTKIDGGITRSESGANRHTGTGLAWRLSPTSIIRSIIYPMRQRVAYLRLTNGVPRTFTIWVKRTNSSTLSGRLICKKGQIAGITTDQIHNASAASNTYEQLTLTLTSTEDGIVELHCEAWGGTTESMYIDDPEI